MNNIFASLTHGPCTNPHNAVLEAAEKHLAAVLLENDICSTSVRACVLELVSPLVHLTPPLFLRVYQGAWLKMNGKFRAFQEICSDCTSEKLRLRCL